MIIYLNGHLQCCGIVMVRHRGVPNILSKQFIWTRLEGILFDKYLTESQYVNKSWWRLHRHSVAAAINAQPSDKGSVIDCKPFNPEVQSHAELA